MIPTALFVTALVLLGVEAARSRGQVFDSLVFFAVLCLAAGLLLLR